MSWLLCGLSCSAYKSEQMLTTSGFGADADSFWPTSPGYLEEPPRCLNMDILIVHPTGIISGKDEKPRGSEVKDMGEKRRGKVL